MHSFIIFDKLLFYPLLLWNLLFQHMLKW